MQLTVAQQAAALVPQIAQLQAIVTEMQALQAEKAVFGGTVYVVSPSLGNINIQGLQLTADESGPIWTSLISVFQARLAAVDAQLTAL